MGKREDIRADLTERLLQAAIDEICANGLKGLRARDITARAKCALGTIYKCYTDLDDLIMHVNSHTLHALHTHLSSVAKKWPNPHDRMVALAKGYAGFAQSHQPQWAAIFDHELPVDRDIPDWHHEDQARLLKIIAEALGEIYPNAQRDRLIERAKTIFSAAHGVIAFALQQRFSGVDQDQLDMELEALARMVTAVQP